MTVNNHTSNPPPQNDPIALLLPVLLHVRWLKLPSPSLPEAPSAPSAFVHMALLCVWSTGRHLSVVRPGQWCVSGRDVVKKTQRNDLGPF